MDHGHMNHGHMDHDMPGMPGMGGGHMCNMNMIFTWDTTDLCIVFHWWHVSGPWSLVLSLLGVVLLTAGYELVREASRRFELTAEEGSTRLPRQHKAHRERRDRTIKAVLYAVQVFYSFFIMLLFMTYNGFVMLAVAVGAFVGYIFFSQGPASKTVACH